jgi:hypothetical protein
MSLWSIINGSAWALCAVLAILIIVDIIKVEKERYKAERNG